MWTDETKINKGRKYDANTPITYQLFNAILSNLEYLKKR